ncbi:MAG: S8 family peptidase, partial [Pseudomonadota bacterium]
DIAGTSGLGDDGNHGSQVAGVLLGARNGSASHGVAFNATLLALRTDNPGSCEGPNPVVQGGCFHDYSNIATAVDLARTTGARVVNLSIVGPAASAQLLAAVDRATAAGIVIVISAGNERTLDPTGLAQLANGPSARGLVVVAGALDATNANLTGFSARAGNSAAHYLSALGLSVRTVNAAGMQSTVSGTSFSAPVISGAVALLAQAFPNLSGGQIVDLLFRTANDLGAAGTDTVFGGGALNLARAFAPQGLTALAGSAVPVTLGGSNGITSGAIGDGGSGGAAAVILDSYGRAYNVELGGAIRAAPATAKLAPALGVGTHGVVASLGAANVALSVAPSRRGSAVDALRLSPQDRDVARVLAGSVVTRLGQSTQIGFAFGKSSLALLDQLTLKRGAAFLAAERASDSLGFYQEPGSAYAIGHRLGGFLISASLESGRERPFESGLTLSPRDRERGYRYDRLSIGADRQLGRFAFGGRLTRLEEGDTVLGARFSPLIGNGATSWLADVSVRLVVGRDLEIGALWRQGWTRVAAGGAREQGDLLRANAWSFDVQRDRLLGRTDSLSFRIAQPLRISNGGLNLTLPTGYDYVTQSATFGISRINLAPEGRELDFEAAYSLPFAGGLLGTNLYWRKDPGNIASASSDIGGAVRVSFGF